jgi:LysR family hydrogen peroxide-inducible transcriptional activator
MNFQQLAYVIAVDQYKHFADAAESRNITQATLSAMIKKLEQELGTKLFDRSKHPVVTTEDGIAFISKAKEILNLQGDLFELGSSNAFQSGGVLKIGMIPTVANALLPLTLPHLLKTFPELTLEIVELTTENIIEQLNQDKIDVGILATPLEDQNFEEVILYYESMMVYGINDQNKKFIPTKDVKNQKIWLLEEGNCFRNQSITICNVKEKVMSPENLNFAGNSFETLINLTDQFGGYTLIPELYQQFMPEERKLKTRHFELPLPVREISMVYSRPYSKKRSIDLIASEIKAIIVPKLYTTTLKAKDLSIIGI